MTTITPPERTVIWSNRDNAEFYEKVSLEDLRQYAKSSGIDEAIDVKNLFPEIIESKSILEVNAGYGRVVTALLSLNFTGKISVIERNNDFCNHMKKALPHSINIICGNVMKYDFKNQYDSILLMWSCITEFNPEEQFTLLLKLKHLLTIDGKIIIDLIDENSILNHVSQRKGRYIEVEKDNKIERFYLPTTSELDSWLDFAGLTTINKISYKTKNNLKRTSYIIKKR